MVLNILSNFINVDDKRRLVEVFPDPVRKQWNKWELRGLVLLSLTLQTSLIYSGHRRKYIAKRRIRIFIWCAYLLADWIATVALGLLVDRQGNSASSSSNNSNKDYGDLTLMAFWAPFLLLHLGGPDTITAYALADNELWLRHLLGLVVQTAAAIYITLLAWDGSVVSVLTVPMLVCGIIKYGERSWVLMSANREQFRDSVLADQDPGPNYARFMEEFCLKEAEGYYVAAVQVDEGNSPEDDVENTEGAAAPSVPNPDASTLDIADYFFETLKFKRLFVDLILGFHPRDVSQSFFEKQEYNTAFEVIEIELGFAYDVFYTKVPIIYTPFGLFFRLATSFITLSVLLTFVASMNMRPHKHQPEDVVITCILLIGAILLEAYAAISLLFSDWANLWLSHRSSKFPFKRVVSSLQSSQKGKRWSNSMYQYSLIDFCLNHKSSSFQKISKVIPLHKRIKNLWEKWESMLQLKHLTTTPELKSFIFNHFKEKSTNTELDLKILNTCRGAVSLRTHKSYGTFKWTVDVEFDHSILIWHIATDLCFNLDKIKRVKDDSDGEEFKQEWNHYMILSKQLADYMLYILVMCPFMLPIGIGMIRFRDTCAEAMVFFKERNSTSKLEAYEMLGQVSTKVFPATVKGDRSKSVLFEACKLAASLSEMGDSDPGKMWKMVGDVWVEILGYAASQCRGFDHAQQLEKGGELLTHVWLLMAHLGITEHFKIEEGHGRVKLAVT
ncbi:hypothetical protein HanPSC8_Chr08g0316581 [Helianthus annuus]|nr:hypothetical protein HanPSC8_Chr08g0316581 [Helianthus annuus]